MRRPRGILWRDLCGGGLDTLLFRADRENVIMYVSWVLSPAQLDEDTTGTALTKWKSFGMPMIYLNYFMDE